MKSSLYALVALSAVLLASPEASAASGYGIRSGQLTVTEVKDLRIDAHALTAARDLAMRDGIVTRAEHQRIERLESRLRRESQVYMTNRYRR